MADIKHRDGKWVVVSDEKDSKGHPKKEEHYSTKSEAEQALKRWEGEKYHAEGKKPVRAGFEISAKKGDKYDVKQKSNGKWVVVDKSGKQYPESGEHKTEKGAVARLKEMAGWEAHGEGKKKKSEMIDALIVLADDLDDSGFKKEADVVDGLIKGLIKE